MQVLLVSSEITVIPLGRVVWETVEAWFGVGVVAGVLVFIELLELWLLHNDGSYGGIHSWIHGYVHGEKWNSSEDKVRTVVV